MPQVEAKLPSGAIVKLRGLKGQEINTFANASAARRGRTSLQVLKSITIATIDPGPLYDGKVDWDSAPQCDRFTALYHARNATFGESYSFRHQCSDCRAPYEWEVDMSEVVVKPLPEESIANLLDKNRFKTELVDNDGNNVPVVFQLMTPKLEKRIEKVTRMAPKDRATAALAQRIISIGDMTDKGDIKRYLEDLDAGSIYDLTYDMDDVDGGIETTGEVDCPHCGHIEDVELFGRAAYWSPKKRRRSTKQ